MDEKIIKKYLPLTETTYYILLCMEKPNHGYAIMQQVDEMTAGAVILGPGTLYGATTKLVKDGVIALVEGEGGERKKSYILTPLGREILKREYVRLGALIANGKPIIEGMV
ncbi:MAG: PadR family transcriptional regulator [Cellulosilyticaceae bacterium]